MLGQTAKAKLEACRGSLLEQDAPVATTVHDSCYSEILIEIRTTLARCEKEGGDLESLWGGFKSLIEIDDPGLNKAIAE